MSVTDADVAAGIPPAQREGEARPGPADRRRVPQPGRRSPTADLQTRFDANKESYRIGEKRKVKYALLEVEKVRESRAGAATPTCEAFYNQNKAQYTTEGRVRASHILLKTEGKDEAAVKARPRSC